MRKVDLKIEDVAFGGKGVGRESGKAVFVPFTIDGERVTAEIVRDRKKFSEAEVAEILQPSPHRVTPECPYFKHCGGCLYQHIDYEHQVALKWRQARDILQRIGKLENVPIRPIIPSPRPYNYRNRITVHADGGTLGFFRRDSHRLIDVERCPIAMDGVNQKLTELRASHPADGHYTLRADVDAPRVFRQANDFVADSLRELVSQFIPSGQEQLIDAYCGAGFFAKALREKFKRVIGIDWDRFAIEAAQQDATEKETYIAGDVDIELGKIVAPASRADLGKTTLIVDPPATGLSRAARQIIAKSPPATLIYISCNPPTLARDLADLKKAFRLESVTPLDMFPQTAEIEIVAHLKWLAG